MSRYALVYLRVYDLQLPRAGLRLVRCTDQSNKRGTKQHLHYSSRSIICTRLNIDRSRARSSSILMVYTRPNGSQLVILYPFRVPTEIHLLLSAIPEQLCYVLYSRKILIEVSEEHIRRCAFGHVHGRGGGEQGVRRLHDCTLAGLRRVLLQYFPVDHTHRNRSHRVLCQIPTKSVRGVTPGSVSLHSVRLTRNGWLHCAC